ncbi:hypothetical protein ACODT3_01015 [Streptomyces sp. 4.24]|uniref:hypothetical protein n=1 Tax=Streptomyces tritrimontium TaxID=3406573 RepID=UPI003BB52F6F
MAALAVSAVLGAAAQAAPRADTDVVFEYSAPDISEGGDHVTWDWTVMNNTGHSVSRVVFTTKITPTVVVTRVSPRCEVPAQGSHTIRCTFPGLDAGAAQEGVIEADLPAGLEGSVNISGRVTWQNPAAKAIAPADR